MKKFYTALLILATILTACSGDDNKNSQTENIEIESVALIGKWKPKTVTTSGRTQEYQTNPCDLDMVREFKDNMQTIEYHCTMNNDHAFDPSEDIATYTLNTNDIVIESQGKYLLKAKITELTDKILKMEFYYTYYASSELNNNDKYTVQYNKVNN